MIYEASVRGVIGPVLIAEFGECEISTGNAATTLRFSQAALAEVLARIQDFGLDLIDLRLRVDPASTPDPNPAAE